MTTIAWDGRTLAADGQITLNDMITDTRTQKIFRQSQYYVDDTWHVEGHNIMAFGYSGTYGADRHILELLRTDLTSHSELPEMFSLSCLLVGQDGQLWAMNTAEGKRDIQVMKVGEPFKAKYAIGSGQPYALAAMKSGASAVGAVDIAITLDIFSGGDVQYWQPIISQPNKHRTEFNPDPRPSLWMER